MCNGRWPPASSEVKPKDDCQMKLLRLADLSKAAVQNRHSEADFWIFQTLWTAYSCMAVLSLFPFLTGLDLTCRLCGFQIRICCTGSPLHALTFTCKCLLLLILPLMNLQGTSSTRLSENKTMFSLKSLFSPDEGGEEMKKLVVRNELCPCKQIAIEISPLCGLP